MKKAIIIANTKWFILNFKNWLIKELSNTHQVEIIYLREGPPSKMKGLNEKNNIKFRKLNFVYLFKNLFENENYDVVLSFTAFGIFVTPFLYPFSIKKIATIEGLGRLFSSRELPSRFLKKILLIYYKFVFNFFFDKIVVLNYCDISYLLDLKVISIGKIRYIPGTGIDTEIFSRKNMSNIKSLNKEINICTDINLGTGKSYSVIEVIRAFERASGKKIPYKITGRREGDIDEICADPTYASHFINWEAKYDLDKMCADV